MPLRFEGDTAHFESHCTAEEALALVDFLLATASPKLAFDTDAHLHCALLQVLAASRCELTVAPSDAFLAQCLAQFQASSAGDEALAVKLARYDEIVRAGL